jgi:hypothetical protein
VLPLVLALAMGCPGGRGESSTAADTYIAQASSDEERKALIEARDEIDAEMRVQAAERDAEIERLRRENEDLRRRLRERSW